jgi:hypothetical protein
MNLLLIWIASDQWQIVSHESSIAIFQPQFAIDFVQFFPKKKTGVSELEERTKPHPLAF